MKNPKPIIAFCAVTPYGELLWKTMGRNKEDVKFEMTERVLHKSLCWAAENGYRIVKVEIKVIGDK